MGKFWGGQSCDEKDIIVNDLKEQVKTLKEALEANRRKADEAESALKSHQCEADKAAAALQEAKNKLQELETTLKATTEELESIKRSTENEKNNNTAINNEVEKLKAELAKKDAEIAALKCEVEKAKAEQPKASEPTPVALPEIPNYTPQIDEIKTELVKLSKAYQEQVRKDDLFNSMHKEVDKLRNDLYSKMVTPYKKSIIALYDSIARTYDYYSAEGRSAEEGAYDKLLTQVKNYMLSVIDTLCDEYNLDSFDAEPGEPFNRSTHKTLNIVATDDPAKDNTVARAHQCGFRYTAFDPVKGMDRDVIFRQAFVDVYKLKKQ